MSDAARPIKASSPPDQQDLDLNLPAPPSAPRRATLPTRPTEEELHQKYKYHCVVPYKYPVPSPDRFNARLAIETLMRNKIRKQRGTAPEDFRTKPTVDPLTGICIEVANTQDGWVLYEKKDGRIITEMHRYVNAEEGYATWIGHSMSGSLVQSVHDQPDIVLSDKIRAELKFYPMREATHARFLTYQAERRIAYQESIDELSPQDYARAETKVRAQEEARAAAQARRQDILNARADAKRKLKAQKKEKAKARAAERARKQAEIKERLRGANAYRAFSSNQSKQHSKNHPIKHKHK